ncbi:MAG: HTH domain-containing protein [Oscillochloris sp.]|nr:HTH domain-containing protein [Oscillochloris sp.]
MPLAAIEIGQRVELNPRQVHYNLRVVKDWLARRNIALQNIPGVGAQVRCTPSQRRQVLADLHAYSRLQLVLSADQRQQLLLFTLLIATDPLVAQQFQEALDVSRSTVLKDLDAVRAWLASFDLGLVRRQHTGSWLEGSELAIRQALVALLWGDVPFARPIFAMEHGAGLTCTLLPDADLLPALIPVRDLVAACNLNPAITLVSRAESILGWRFSDESALYLDLAFFIQSWRIQSGRYIACNSETLSWLSAQSVWSASAALIADYRLVGFILQHEIAATSMLLLSCPHEGGTVIAELAKLIDAALNQIIDTYGLPGLCDDVALYDGLISQIGTAVLGRRFGIWLPPRSAEDLPDGGGETELGLVDQIDALFVDQTGSRLLERHRHSLTLLLHAAQTRARPARAQRVLVVCPSGMATTQLLVARLRSRFPGRGSYEVVPLRQLSLDQIATADLIITTIPLGLDGATPIVQVHPSLMPADVAALDRWLD